MAKCYREDGRAGDFLLDLLELKLPELFAAERGRGEDEKVRHNFTTFLWDYILRCGLKHTILEEMRNILVRETNSHMQMTQDTSHSQ